MFLCVGLISKWTTKSTTTWIMMTKTTLTHWVCNIFISYFFLFKTLLYWCRRWNDSNLLEINQRQGLFTFIIHLLFFLGFCVNFVLILHSLYFPLWSWISSTLILVSLIVMPPMIMWQLKVLKPLLGIYTSLSFFSHSSYLLFS